MLFLLGFFHDFVILASCVFPLRHVSVGVCVVEVIYFWLFPVLLWKFISHAFLSVFLSSLCHCLDSIQLCFVTLLFPLPLLSINSLSVTVADCGVTVWRRTQNAGLLWWAVNLLLVSGKKHNYIQIPILWPLWKFFLNPHTVQMSMKGEKAATPKTPVSTLWLPKHTPLSSFWDHTNTLRLAGLSTLARVFIQSPRLY